MYILSKVFIIPRSFQVAYISFSAHTDYTQTSDFIRALRPPHLVLVHGEMNEMNRLKAAIIRQYEDESDFHIEVKHKRYIFESTLSK